MCILINFVVICLNADCLDAEQFYKMCVLLRKTIEVVQALQLVGLSIPGKCKRFFSFPKPADRFSSLPHHQCILKASPPPLPGGKADHRYQSSVKIRMTGATCLPPLHHVLLTPWSRVLLEKLTGSAASQEIPAFLEPEGSSPYSQVPATCPYTEPTPSSPHNPLPLSEDPS